MSEVPISEFNPLFAGFYLEISKYAGRHEYGVAGQQLYVCVGFTVIQKVFEAQAIPGFDSVDCASQNSPVAVGRGCQAPSLYNEVKDTHAFTIGHGGGF